MAMALSSEASRNPCIQYQVDGKEIEFEVLESRLIFSAALETYPRSKIDGAVFRLDEHGRTVARQQAFYVSGGRQEISTGAGIGISYLLLRLQGYQWPISEVGGAGVSRAR